MLAAVAAASPNQGQSNCQQYQQREHALTCLPGGGIGLAANSGYLARTLCFNGLRVRLLDCRLMNKTVVSPYAAIVCAKAVTTK